MKVKIKSKKEINKLKGSFSSPTRDDVPFVSEMYDYCNKKFHLKLLKESFWLVKTYKTYKIIENERFLRENFFWSHWMFDIIEEIDKKGNYLLDFN